MVVTFHQMRSVSVVPLSNPEVPYHNSHSHSIDDQLQMDGGSDGAGSRINLRAYRAHSRGPT